MSTGFARYYAALAAIAAVTACERGAPPPTISPGSDGGGQDAAAAAPPSTSDAGAASATGTAPTAPADGPAWAPPVRPKSTVPMHPAVADLLARRKPADTRAERQQQLVDVLEGVSKDHSRKREEVILNAIDQGLADEPSWTVIESRYQGHVARIRVSTDALKVNGVRVSLSAVGAQHVADRMGTILPTARILDLVWQEATLKLTPCTLPPDRQMQSTQRMLEHSRCVDERIGGKKGLAANVGKNWVVTNEIAKDTDKAANYGWFRRAQRPIQTVGTHHDKGYTDYSQIVRLVDPVVSVDGHKMDIRKVAASHELWGLVSDEGPIRLWRMALRGSSATEAIEPAPPEPVPPFPSGKKPLVALADGRHPFPLERLPDDLAGLRHVRLGRKAADALGVGEGDLPEQALWSANAVFCGSHDLFFELATGTAPPKAALEADRASLKTGLECGRKAAQAAKTRLLHEVEYLFEGEPVSFGILRSVPGQPAIPAVYPLLPAPPPGARAAACRDADAVGDHACHHGGRSRIFVEVEGGNLGTHAREAPFLLERLGRTGEPSAESRKMRELYDRLDAHDLVRVARGEDCATAWDPALVVSPSAATSRIQLFHKLMDHAAFCAVARSGSLHDGRVALAYAPARDGSAREIESALRQRLAALRLEEPPADASSAVEARYRAARRDILRRAIGAAKIEQKDGLVTLSLELAPAAAERGALSSWVDERSRGFARAGELVTAIVDGKPLP